VAYAVLENFVSEVSIRRLIWTDNLELIGVGNNHLFDLALKELGVGPWSAAKVLTVASMRTTVSGFRVAQNRGRPSWSSSKVVTWPCSNPPDNSK
jgi:hypothetical protein